MCTMQCVSNGRKNVRLSMDVVGDGRSIKMQNRNTVSYHDKYRA